MTIQQIEYFLTAAELCNLSKAAGFHYVSIPTFTRHITNLETELCAMLFERNNRGLTLTDAGALFHPLARDTLLSIYDYQHELATRGILQGEQEDTFVIAYYGFGGVYPALAKLVDRYLVDWLRKPCRLRCVQSGTMTNLVLSGRVQAGTVSAVELEKHAGMFEARTFYRSEFHLLVGQNHPLAGHDSVEAEELLHDYGTYDSYIPMHSPDSKLRGRPIDSPDAIRAVGKMCIESLPHIQNYLESEEENEASQTGMFILPADMRRPDFKNFHPVKIMGANVTLDRKLFWKKDNTNPDIARFMETLSFIDIN